MPHLTIYNSQLYGGPDGELGAAMRYLSQRYSNTNRKVAGVLTDIGTEELAHMEMICAIVHQLTKNLNAKELEEQGFAPYYIDHTIGIWPQAVSLGAQPAFSQPVTRLPICMKIWQQSRRLD